MDVNQHGGRAGGEDRRRHGQCRALHAMRGSRWYRNRDQDFSSVDKMPLFMAATPDFVQKNPDEIVAYCKAWLDAGRDFKENPGKVTDVIYGFYTDKGYTMSRESFAKALARVDVNPGFPRTSSPTCRSRPKSCCGRTKISAIPDWSKRCGRISWRRHAPGREPRSLFTPGERTE